MGSLPHRSPALQESSPVADIPAGAPQEHTPNKNTPRNPPRSPQPPQNRPFRCQGRHRRETLCRSHSSLVSGTNSEVACLPAAFPSAACCLPACPLASCLLPAACMPACLPTNCLLPAACCLLPAR
eukprot:14984442-Alexandrium_andersonii.AAC.1